jgi:hypothetical protein
MNRIRNKASRIVPTLPPSVPYNPVPISYIPLYRLAGNSPVRALWTGMGYTPLATRPTTTPDFMDSSDGWYYILGDDGKRVYTRPFIDSGGLHNTGIGHPDMDDTNPATGEVYRPKRSAIRDTDATRESVKRLIGRNNGKGTDCVPGQYVTLANGKRREVYRIPTNPCGTGLVVDGRNPLAQMRGTDENTLYRLSFGFGRRLITKRLGHESVNFQIRATALAVGDIYQTIIAMLCDNYDPTKGTDTPNPDGTTTPLYIAPAKTSNKPDSWIGKPIVEGLRFYAYHAMREYGRTYTPRLPGLFIVRRKDPLYQTVDNKRVGRWNKIIPVDRPTNRACPIVTIGTNYDTTKPTQLSVNRDTDSVWSVVTDRVFTFYRTVPYECPRLTDRKDWQLATPINVPMGLYRTTDPARSKDKDSNDSVLDRIIDNSTDPAKIAERNDTLSSVGKRMASEFAKLSESDLMLIRKAMRGERTTQPYPKGATKETKQAINNANDIVSKRTRTLIATLSAECA